MDERKLYEPRFLTHTGSGAFKCTAPKLYNFLSRYIKMIDKTDIFKKKLKKNFFHDSYDLQNKNLKENYMNLDS